jgi:hypothetical protein
MGGDAQNRQAILDGMECKIREFEGRLPVEF